MEPRRYVLLVLAAFASMGASFRTQNFVVQAANQQVAEQVGQYAEKYRREKALEWLGREMPTWGQPCPLRVTITPGGAGGATTFAFDNGAIMSQEMNIQGSLERVLNSVLPHEVTHTVFAYHFRCPLPRWADEGGSVLSEDDLERKRHDDLVRQCLAGGRAFRLRVLFGMKQYPDSGNDVMTLYAQGYSLCRFLVESSDRRTFLNFVGDGMRSGWDRAVQTHYQMSNLEELEETWLNWMRGVYKPTDAQLVKNTKPTNNKAARPVAQLQQPVVRGASNDENGNRPPPLPPKPAPDGWSPVHVPQKGRGAQLLPVEPDSGFVPPAKQALQSMPRQ